VRQLIAAVAGRLGSELKRDLEAAGWQPTLDYIVLRRRTYINTEEYTKSSAAAAESSSRCMCIYVIWWWCAVLGCMANQ